MMRWSSQERGDPFETEMVPQLDAAFRLAYALTGHKQDAEDLVQDAYLRAFAGFQRYERGTNARAWLLTIVRHVFLNDRRRARVRPLLTSLTDREEKGFDPVDTQTPGPEEELLRAADSKLVLEALAELPEPVRSVLALVDLQGMRYSEAAQILDCPIGTVMSRLYRGRRALARRLQASRAEVGAS